jgi:hypothetical protein
MTTTLEGGEGSVSRPGRSLPPGKTRYPLYRRLGGPQGRSGQVRKISPPTGIRSPDRPARSQSLYRLSYPALLLLNYYQENTFIKSVYMHVCLCVHIYKVGLHCRNEPFFPASRGIFAAFRSILKDQNFYTFIVLALKLI